MMKTYIGPNDNKWDHLPARDLSPDVQAKHPIDHPASLQEGQCCVGQE